MRQNSRQQNGKRKSKLQPKSKVKYRNLKSNYDRLEGDDFQINYKSKRKQRFNDDEQQGKSSKSKRNRQRTKINYDYQIEDDDYDFDY